MTFRNEVMDFVATYRAMNPAKSGQDRYYDVLRREQEKQDKIAKDAIAAENKRRAAAGKGSSASDMPTSIVPQVVPPPVGVGGWSHGAPTGPTTALATDYPQLPPTYRRGGPVRKFQAGGATRLDDIAEQQAASENEADLIVQSLLRRDMEERARSPATTATINQGIPQPENVPYADYGQGARARPGADLPSSQAAALPTRKEMVQRGMASPQSAAAAEEAINPRTSWLDRNVVNPVMTRVRPAVAAMTEPFGGPAYGTGRPEDADPDYLADPENAAARARARRVGEIRPGVTEKLTEDELAAREREIRDLTNVDEVERKKMVEGVKTPLVQTAIDLAAAGSGRTGPVREEYPELGPNSVPYQPPRTSASAPSVYGKVGGLNETGGTPEVAKPGSYPTQTAVPPKASNGPPGGGTGSNGPAGGNTGPGSGSGTVQAPPARAMRTEDPRTRTAAFDPGRERINPDQTTGARQFDTQGQLVAPTQQELAQMVATAAQPHIGNGMSHVGAGAVNRDTVQALVADTRAQSNAPLTEGQALLVGMHAKFKYLLSQGKAKEAATMAWGLIQAANLEAAALGLTARDQIRAGDLAGGRATLAHAANWAIDGVTHQATPNGIASTDANGRVTHTVLDGRRALQMALSLADGSATWSLLQNAASLVMPKDNNAEGRLLRNELTRLQIEGARRKLAGGGGKGGGAPSGDLTKLRHYLAGTTPPSSGGGGGGDNDSSWISNSAANAEDQRENS